MNVAFCHRRKLNFSKLSVLLGFILFASNVFATETAGSDSDIAKESAISQEPNATNKGLTEQQASKKLYDPLAKLIFFPISGQYFNNYNGPAAGNSAYEVSIRPTMPVELTDHIIAINHAVIPYFNLPTLDPITGHNTGAARQNFLEPIQLMSLFTLDKANGWNAGFGPYVSIPLMAGYDNQPQYNGVGAAAIVRYSGGPIVFAGTIQNAWDIGSKNQSMLAIPSLAYNYSNGWSFVSAPYITANFNTGGFVLPIGGGAGKVVKIGKMPVMINSQTYYNIVKNAMDPNWETRLNVMFVFPR